MNNSSCRAAHAAMQSDSHTHTILTVGSPKIRVFWPKDPLKDSKRIQKACSWVLILRIIKVTVVHESWFWGSDTALLSRRALPRMGERNDLSWLREEGGYENDYFHFPSKFLILYQDPLQLFDSVTVTKTLKNLALSPSISFSIFSVCK